MRAVHLDGRRVAVTTARGAHLDPSIDQLRPGDPMRRFVAAMCVFSLSVDDGSVAGAYTDARAEAAAREALLPAEILLDEWELADGELGARHGLPVKQVGLRRLEV